MSTDQSRGAGAARGASSPQLMRQANRQALLRLALSGTPFTAAAAMAATGLARATVLGVCTDLRDAGWLEETAGERAGGGVAGAVRAGPRPQGQGTTGQRGRPARTYRLRSDAGVLVGIDAGEHTLTVQVTDLAGRPRATVSCSVPGGVAAGPAARVEALRELIDRALAKADARACPRVLTVIGVPAPVDEHGRSPRDEVGFWTTMNPGLVDALSDGAGPVLVENDANLAAIAEHAGGTGDHVVTLLMGERFGAGLIVDGRLLRGSAGGAGEMRFLDLALEDGHGADGVAALARRWVLEQRAGQDDAAHGSPLARIPAERLTAVDVFRAAEAGDDLALAVLDRIGDRLARIVAILSSLLGVETVVVAGAIAGAIEPVLDRARRTLPQLAGPSCPEVIASEHGLEVVVHGAIELALARLREDPLALLDPTRGDGSAAPARAPSLD